uniref:Uncharacterized protein n=1 Tax=Arundo donax TaxID=35708 RepID=A0A0A9BXS6_ARUDO
MLESVVQMIWDNALNFPSSDDQENKIAP